MRVEIARHPLENEQAYRGWYQQFEGSTLNEFLMCQIMRPFDASTGLRDRGTQSIPRTDACHQKQQHHEPRIEQRHDGIPWLHLIETAHAAKHTLGIVEIDDVVKQHQKHCNPTDIVQKVFAFHNLFDYQICRKIGNLFSNKNIHIKNYLFRFI